MTYPPPQPGQPDPQQPQQPGGYPQQQPGGYPQQPGAYPQPGYQTQQPAPPAAPPKKKGKGKVVLLVVAGMLALCCGGGAIFMVANSGGSSSGGGSGTTAAQHVKVGQAARDGKFEFTVAKVECGKPQVGDEVMNKAAQGQFCLVSVSVKNISNQPQMFNGSSQKAVGAAGVKYDNDGLAETYANKDTATFLNNINPGNAVAGVLVFDIPKGAAIKSLELHDSPFSGGVTVDVG